VTPDAIKETMASAITAAREDLHLNQTQMATIVGITRGQLNRLERGHRWPSAATLAAILSVGNRDLAWALRKAKR
jgi:transcriptional regulator with XRE-family HTH domain